MTLGKIIEMVKKASESNKLDVRDSLILECSVRIFNTQRMHEFNSEEAKEPPTERQVYALEKAGYKRENINKLSKHEASERISKLKGNKI